MRLQTQFILGVSLFLVATLKAESPHCAAMGGTTVSAYVSKDRSVSSTPVAGAMLIQRCVKTIPGTTCGLDPVDPNLSAAAPLNINEPNGADKLFISVMGGGACFSAETCGLIGPVALATNTRNRSNFWVENAKQNPFTMSSHGVMDSTYRQYEIPYCTGDAHLGNKITNYISTTGIQKFRHQGFTNFSRYLDFIKSRNPNPKKIIVIGESAGGIGLNGNLEQIRDRWPNQPLVVVQDSGLPLSKSFLGSNLVRALENWGTEKTIPNLGYVQNPDPMDGIRYNIAKYGADKNLRFGLIQPYTDIVEFFFAVVLGLPTPFVDSFHAITDQAYRYYKATTNFKVNAFNKLGEGEMHVCYAACPYIFPERGLLLDAWVKDMVNGSPNWDHVMP